MLKKIGGGGCSTISDPTVAAAVPPLGLLHKPCRDRVNGVSNAHPEEVGGGDSAILAAVVGSLRTHDSSGMRHLKKIRKFLCTLLVQFYMPNSGANK